MSDNKQHYFHFTLGPVQGFVSQARRTRDFWAGSFILSWLAAVAIQAVKHQGGTVEFPQPDADYMAWLVGEGKGNKPTQGSIPNRFKGLVAEVDPNTFNPQAVVKSVQEAWKALAKVVWDADLEKVSGITQSNIWNRQVNHFWDMSWVITKGEDSSALDKRKNWRTYAPPEELGVKCAMMDGWQELSGAKSPVKPESAIRDEFWKTVRNQAKCEGMKSDLRENEALCAIAFVKRRFSRHFHNLDHLIKPKYPMQQGWQLKGWKVPSAVPSVTYMAAVHWLKQLLNSEIVDTRLLKDFYDKAYQLTGKEYGEIKTHIKCLENLKHSHVFDQLKCLDGNVFFDTMLENPNIFEEEKQEQAKQVLAALTALRKSAELPKPTPFYAILMMDGDSLGSHMSEINKQCAITEGLADFTNGVSPIVEKNNGFLMYAGGDDVLAILPLEDAISCAAELRTHYMSCFDYNDIPTTLSGAIEFVHIKTPLTKVLHDAHHLLDEVAKDGRGRDALAIRVWKPGGLQLEWAQPWEIALNPQTDKTYLEEIAEDFQTADATDDQFSNKFFYKIHERFTMLNPEKGSKQERILDDDAALSLMAMEYLNSGKSKLNTMDKARDHLRPLLMQCRPVTRILKDGKEQPMTDWTRSKRLEADGALLIRFLAQKGMEK